MKKMKLVLLVALIGLVVLGAGCVGQQGDQSTIRSDAEVSERVTDIGEQVSDISNAVEDVDTSLG
ncbi:MAG: hypothetical protein HYW25_00315 [Candidatus Aenigmarchaeota archaeon]|nr:hypothetical protein [Candidatus Aenigmarchaeota archaeon]